MAVDTFMAYVGVYDSASDADADYELVKDLHTKADLIDAYDAAVVERRADGKVKITKKHETPTRAGGVVGVSVARAVVYPHIGHERVDRHRVPPWLHA